MKKYTLQKFLTIILTVLLGVSCLFAVGCKEERPDFTITGAEFDRDGTQTETLFKLKLTALDQTATAGEPFDPKSLFDLVANGTKMVAITDDMITCGAEFDPSAPQAGTYEFLCTYVYQEKTFTATARLFVDTPKAETSVKVKILAKDLADKTAQTAGFYFEPTKLFSVEEDGEPITITLDDLTYQGEALGASESAIIIQNYEKGYIKINKVGIYPLLLTYTATDGKTYTATTIIEIISSKEDGWSGFH